MNSFKENVSIIFYKCYDFYLLKMKQLTCVIHYIFVNLRKKITHLKVYVKSKSERNKLAYENYFTHEYNATKSHNPIYNFVLDQLNCVDSKSSSLLTYNGLVIAFTSCLIGFQSNLKLLPLLLEVILWVNILLLLISSLLCLFSIDIFSPHILKEDYTTDDYIQKVTSIAYKRTIWYRKALKITQISALLFIIFFIRIFILFFLKPEIN